ncbi:fatty acid--CoA ligase [Rhizobium sp. S152]|uniref:fatty acid--CoA ligase n=1 Tax=Rhizobium sp. S152 TaxID=3055038 RepID=UPI0025A98CCB|nr:fatty acid--CoA ligase [Rhizobium sp. S152]MDM9627810.1 fatty acid--CoA ligase [Rhizobium sp. S152]
MTGKFTQASSSAYQYPLLVKQLWHAPLQQAPDQVIVYRDCARFTYRELRERIGRLASSLAGLGVAAGDVVGILDWDSHRYLEAYFAVPMMGAVLQTVNVRLSPDQIAYTINHAGASVLLVNDDFAPMLEGIRQHLTQVKTLVSMSDRVVPQTGGLPFAGAYESLLRNPEPGYDFPDFDENVPATTFYTTGTSGQPKGVVFSHRQLVLHSLAEMAFLGTAAKQGRFCRDDVYMPMTPMFHAHAWGLPWTATLSGVKQVYPGRYDPGFLLKLIKTEGVTFTHCVPTLLQRLLDAATAAKTDLAGLKMVIGGSELSNGLAKQALALGVDVFAGYGMSESAPLLCMAQIQSADLSGDTEKEAAIRTKAGLAAPLVDLRLIDAGGNEVAADGKTRGEIVLRAPWLAQGYIDNPKASEELWSGGYMHTGDIGVIEPNGYLRVVDRIKDVIKTGGEWVSSLEIEDLLSRCDGVSDAAVIGVNDKQWGERPLAFVVKDARTGVDLTDTKLKMHLKGFADAGVISKYAIPDKILFVEQLPKTSVGKVNKKELREKYDNR